MRAVLILTTVAVLGLTACETTPAPDGPVTGDNGNDCAVIAAVAKEHYRFNTTDNRPPPVKFEDGYTPRCDWSRYGLAFTPYDENAPGDPRERMRFVSFARPVYDGRGATIATGIIHGPLAGMGYECRVISGFVGWTVPEGSCRNTWVS